MKNNDKKRIRDFFLMIATIVTMLGSMKFFFGTTCPMKILVGLPCPGCGLTRAFELLLKGEVKKSFRMHPFLIFFLGIFVLELFFKTKGKKYSYIKNGYIIIVIVLAIIFYCWRMTRFFPGEEPMKYYDDNLASKLRLLSGL